MKKEIKLVITIMLFNPLEFQTDIVLIYYDFLYVI
jgi:hypothetical protein